jgi:hypothetical protein
MMLLLAARRHPLKSRHYRSLNAGNSIVRLFGYIGIIRKILRQYIGNHIDIEGSEPGQYCHLRPPVQRKNVAKTC